MSPGSPRNSGCAIPPRLLIALAFMAFGVVSFYLKNPKKHNPVTDEEHHIGLTVPEQIALGLNAAPEMMQQHGGELRDPKLQAEIDRIGMKLIRANAVGDWEPVFAQYKWDFHLLADPETINAFALPGGQVFFTYGLYKHLKTEDEVAGVLGHEIGHVIAEHSAQQMAKSGLIQSVAQGVMVAASDGQHAGGGQMAQMIGAVLTTKYGRGDETQADTLGVQFMINAGYNPNGLLGVMKVLKEISGGSRQPEFLSTHPNPENRAGHIDEVIEMVKSGKLEGPK